MDRLVIDKINVIDLVNNYLCSDGYIAIVYLDNRLLGIFGKTEYEKLIRLIANCNNTDEISVLECINKNACTLYDYESVEAFFDKTGYSYVPIIDDDNRFIRFEKNYHSKRTTEEKNYLINVIAERWRIMDKYWNENQYAEAKCPICNSIIDIGKAKQKRSICIFGGGALRRYECNKCGAIVGPLKMYALSTEDFENDYEQHYKVFSEGDTTEDEIITFFHLDPQKGKKYLNYGCGGSWSKSIEILRKQGYDIYGYEPYATETASDYIITSRDKLSEYRFDGIMTNNLIEHLKSPVDEILFMKSLLRCEDSLMAHSTGCFEYLYPYTRFHVCFPVGKSAQILFNKVGMKIKEKYKEIYHNDMYICYVIEKDSE